MHLREKFATDIRTQWNVIVEATFVNEETIIIYSSPDADFDEFAECVKDTIYDYVEFDEHFNLLLCEMGIDEVVEIQIN